VKTIRSILMFLLLPILIIAFYWEAGLPLPTAGHAFAQILIVVIICALALRIARIDEMERLKEINGSYATRYHKDPKNGEVVWSLHVEKHVTSIEANNGNGHWNESHPENTLECKYPFPLDEIVGGNQLVPKVVK
jgi:hypothetical protein